MNVVKDGSELETGTDMLVFIMKWMNFLQVI
jgi:hypothetical protein